MKIIDLSHDNKYIYRGFKGLSRFIKDCQNEDIQDQEKTASHGTVTPLEKIGVLVPQVKFFKPKVLQNAINNISLCGKREEPESVSMTERNKENLEVLVRPLKLGKTEGAFKKFNMLLLEEKNRHLDNIVIQ